MTGRRARAVSFFAAAFAVAALLLSACGGSSSPAGLDFDDDNPDSKTDLPTFGDDASGDSSDETNVATVAPSVAPTTPPPPATTAAPALAPELVVDATGEDFDRIYRELDGARSYLFANPTAGDAAVYAGPRGGTEVHQYMLANNYRVEHGPDHSYTIDQVTMQARVGDNNVQLLVVDTSTGTSTVVDEAGTVKHTTAPREPATQTFFVELEREPNGPWRIVGDTMVNSIETITEDAPAFAPGSLPPVTETTEIKSGTVTTKTGEYGYSTHWFVAVDGSSCTEARILYDSGEPRVRYAQCFEKALGDAMVESGRLFSIDTIYNRFRLTVFTHYSADVPINTRYGFEKSPFVALGVNSAGENFAVDVAVSGERASSRRLTANGNTIADDTFFGEFFCGEWGANHTVGRTALAANGAEGETRLASRDALVAAIGEHVDAAWYTPDVSTLDGVPPAAFVPGAIIDLPETPDWHTVEIVNPDADFANTTITWAFALDADADGWFIAAWGVHQAC